MLGKNAQSPPIPFAMKNYDGTANASATPTCWVAKDAGDFAVCTNSPDQRNEPSSGPATNAWSIVLTATEMNADSVVLKITSTGCLDVDIPVITEGVWTATKAGYVDTAVSGVDEAVWSVGTRSLTDKAGFSLATAPPTASEIAAAVWAAGTRTLSSFGTLISDIWNNATRSLTDKAGFALTSAYDRAKDALSRTEATSDKDEVLAAIPEAFDAAAADHNTAGSIGEKINAAGSAADPLTAITPGDYAEGTLGHKLGNLGGNGPIRKVYTAYSTDGTTPLPGCIVTAYKDAAMTTPIDSQVSNSNGQTIWWLQTGNVYMHRSYPGLTFNNPDTEEVTE